MGIISQLAGTKSEINAALGQGRRLWRDTFGTTTKEDLGKFPKVRAGGSWTQGAIANPEAFKRLLQAMRSLAPGGWSDDRWEQTKHQTGIQHICIHRIGEQLAQSSYAVYRTDPFAPNGKRPVEDTHPLVRLLKHPNNDDSWGDLMYRWNQQMNLTGTALTWMVPNQLSQPYELYSIPTAIAIPQPAINPDYPDGYYRVQPIYPYGPFSSYPTPATAVGAPIPAQWMLRFKFPHPLLRYDGYSPLTALRLHIDEVEAVDRSRWYAMKRVINPSAVLNMEAIEGQEMLTEAEIERIRAEFENTWQGPENVGRLFVGTNGARLEEFGTVPKDMDYQSGWDQLVSFIMAGFGISKSAAGMIDDTAYATLFATLKQLHLLTLKPLCDRIAAQLTRHVAPFFGDDLIIEIECPRIDDHEMEQQRVTVGLAAKVMTKNEARIKLGLPPTPEAWGNDIIGDPSPLEQQQASAEAQAGASSVPGAPPMTSPSTSGDPLLGEPRREGDPETGPARQDAAASRRMMHGADAGEVPMEMTTRGSLGSRGMPNRVKDWNGLTNGHSKEA